MKRYQNPDADLNWCDLHTYCEDCQFYMDDCDGEVEELDPNDEDVRRFVLDSEQSGHQLNR